ncbi:hypothetical protein FB45DRAFT_737353 [Roridomyces roridus]|uniref:Uncharacterized protein n=1 Tax=Roridomyces roridus TaxID=1738132 RepID=A0AAD7CA01_9AGAR|nr:hypothetical protein FB45DRAFT_737353 [Roridomyces roridus]
MALDYLNGVAPIVTTFGPGNLHHLAYAPQLAGMIDINGVVPTSNEGTTNFVLGYSYYYQGFAFYWDGAGDAFLLRDTLVKDLEYAHKIANLNSPLTRSIRQNELRIPTVH